LHFFALYQEFALSQGGSQHFFNEIKGLEAISNTGWLKKSLKMRHLENCLKVSSEGFKKYEQNQ
jgi:hypothetical protein